LFDQRHGSFSATRPGGWRQRPAPRFSRIVTAAKSTKRRRQRSSTALNIAAPLMGRYGYAARGAIYLMIGLSAGLTTLDRTHRPGGFVQSLKLFQQHWTGGIVLVLLALGLACFAGWLTVSAVYRRDHPGHAHIVLVAGLLGDAAIYIGFVGSLLRLMLGAHAGGDEDVQPWIAWLLAVPFGAALVGLAGAAVALCGFWLISWGLLGDIEGPLELPPIEKRLMLPVGRYGTLGRGLSIALVGFYLMLSALHANPREAHELGGLLHELRQFPYGAWITGAFALAFIGSAVLDFVVASFRRFNPRRP
jgi:hypothetical protein